MARNRRSRPAADRIAAEVADLFRTEQEQYWSRASRVQRMACAGFFDNRKSQK